MYDDDKIRYANLEVDKAAVILEVLHKATALVQSSMCNPEDLYKMLSRSTT